MSDELKPCRACGAPCRVERFSGPNVEAEIWVCSQHRMFGGKCPSTLAYLYEETWNDRPPLDDVEVRARILEEAAKVADEIAALGDKMVRHYDSYGGPELPARRLEVQRASSAREVAAAIRALSPVRGEGE